ncbi:MAG: class I SAM-dependent methyltransferase [Gaiellales bacterium]|nr:MAG: class I SAM-dependent methyltransferase [Gaiellales bacterium]
MEQGRKTSGYYRDEFGRLARFYDGGLSLAFVFAGGEGAFRRAVVAAAGIGAGQRVLDFNCGTGTQAMLVAEMAGTASVTGIDLSPRMIAMAERKARGRPVEFLVANSEDMPFPDATFDRAMTTLAYHEMNREGRANALREVWRVLRPGGRLVIGDLRAPDTLYTRAAMRLLRLFETDTLTDMWQRGIGRELKESGFDVAGSEVVGRGFFEIVTAQRPGREP